MKKEISWQLLFALGTVLACTIVLAYGFIFSNPRFIVECPKLESVYVYAPDNNSNGANALMKVLEWESQISEEDSVLLIHHNRWAKNDTTVYYGSKLPIRKNIDWPISRRMQNFRERNNAPTRIVVHSTANLNDWATAQFHDHYLDTTSRRVSWNYSVDQKEVWMHADPTVYYGLHCGNPEINARSIGIEMCQNKALSVYTDEEYKQMIIMRTQRLISELMQKYTIAWDSITFHCDHANKSCPSLLPTKEERDNFILGI